MREPFLLRVIDKKSLQSIHEKCNRILEKCEVMVLPEEIDQEIEAYFKAL